MTLWNSQRRMHDSSNEKPSMFGLKYILARIPKIIVEIKERCREKRMKLYIKVWRALWPASL